MCRIKNDIRYNQGRDGMADAENYRDVATFLFCGLLILYLLCYNNSIIMQQKKERTEET